MSSSELEGSGWSFVQSTDDLCFILMNTFLMLFHVPNPRECHTAIFTNNSFVSPLKVRSGSILLLIHHGGCQLLSVKYKYCYRGYFLKGKFTDLEGHISWLHLEGHIYRC